MRAPTYDSEPSLADYHAADRAGRLERIATAALMGLCAAPAALDKSRSGELACIAMSHGRALLAALEREEGK